MTKWTSSVLSAGMAIGMGTLATAQDTAEAPDTTRALAAELMADAGDRTNMLAQRNRNFSAKVGGQLMFRYVINSAGDLPGDVDDLTVGFQARRTKISITGKVIDENWDYQILTAFSRSTGAPAPENAYVRRRFEGGWYAMAGQFRLPFLREENLSSTRQLAADRSVMNGFFTQGFSQGVEVGFGGRGEDVFHFAGAFSDGLRSRNTEFDATPADFGLTARAEYKIQGDWGQFRQFTSFPNSDFASLIGAAVHYQGGGSTFGTSDVDVLSATIDASILGNGWHAFAAGVWRNTDIGTAGAFDDFGLLVQGGIFMAESTELFARWDAILADSDRPVGDFHVLTAGVNHYLSPGSHAAKLTLDLQYLLDAPADSLTPGGSTMRGIGLQPADLDDGQWAIRVQMQLLF